MLDQTSQQPHSNYIYLCEPTLTQQGRSRTRPHRSDGRLHGTGHVRKNGEKKFFSLFFLRFLFWDRWGCGFPIFPPTFLFFKKTQKKVFFLELLGRFELPTSSLPSVVEPSSPCSIRLSGGFCPKRMRSQPACSIVSVRSFPRVGHGGVKQLSGRERGRTSDSGKPSRCALSRS